ncbi:MAG: PAS domain-containing sensor histidine kinase [Propionibacteriaceae bacterium]|nr:PAS domain-containing sensor histidine kinase [Propionibacteriaceae bacterium]
MLRIPSSVKPHVAIGEAQAAFLEALIEDWHILADLAFSDLVLWIPGIDPNEYFAIAQIRPATGPTALEDDVVGDVVSYDSSHLVTQACSGERICEDSVSMHQAGIPVDVWAIPLMVDCECWGIIERHTNQMGVRAPGELEDHYLAIAEILSEMASRGVFPDQGHTRLTGISPRVGEGLILIDTSGVVEYASPNAVTVYRKMGLASDLIGEQIVPLTLSLMKRSGAPLDTSLAAHFRSRHSEEVDIDTDDASIFMRILPLTNKSGPIGTLVVCRDTTELRQKERQLVTKDATIREIHHRVKNNLQTVSALLRLQARRMRSTEAQGALEEAMARVQAIAVVHEILSYSMPGAVEFDDVADRLLKLAGDLAAEKGHVDARREGTFGEIPAEVATSLSLVLTELCHNAIEHGLAAGSGTVIVMPQRMPDGSLEVSVVDNGHGLPDGFQVNDKTRTSLGLSIVTTLLEDLSGEFSLVPGQDGIGAKAIVKIPL